MDVRSGEQGGLSGSQHHGYPLLQHVDVDVNSRPRATAGSIAGLPVRWDEGYNHWDGRLRTRKSVERMGITGETGQSLNRGRIGRRSKEL